MPEPYETPTIVQHQIGLMNKFGRLPSTIPIDNIEGIKVDDLVSKYGSPLFVVSETQLRRNYREFYSVFSMRYPQVQIAYSYKTNYQPPICAIFHQEGAWAEVVSGFEYEVAKLLGVPGNRIVFNGPYKTKEELSTAIQDDAVVNIDHIDELYMIEKLAQELGKSVEVGIRVNVNTGMYPPWDRFGFNYESGQAFEAAQRIAMSNELNLVGLHCHIGTYIMDPELYRKASSKVVSLADQIHKKLSLQLKYIDLGGGFPSNNTLHTMWLPAEQVIPDLEKFAEAVTSPIFYGPFDSQNMPMLILEPGRALVDDGIYLITTVVGTKRLPDGKRGLVLDAGVNLLFTAFWYRHDFHVAQESGVILDRVSLFGPLCMNIDVLRPEASLPPVKVGDKLVFHRVGAYNLSQWLQFIRHRPNVVLIQEDQSLYLIREAETTEYVLKPTRVPDRLKKFNL